MSLSTTASGTTSPSSSTAWPRRNALPGWPARRVGFGFVSSTTSSPTSTRSGPDTPTAAGRPTPGGWYGFVGRIERSADLERGADGRRDQTGHDPAPSGTEPGLEADYPLRRGQGPDGPRPDTQPSRRDAGGVDGDLPTWVTSGAAIDLGGDGITYNSASPRQGPNNLQNSPIIVTTADGQLRGWLGGSTPDTTYHIDFFASAGYRGQRRGTGRGLSRSLEVTTDGQGQAIFDVPFTPPAGLPVVTATATDPQGNTSEVSALAGPP